MLSRKFDSVAVSLNVLVCPLHVNFWSLVFYPTKTFAVVNNLSHVNWKVGYCVSISRRARLFGSVQRLTRSGPSSDGDPLSLPQFFGQFRNNPPFSARDVLYRWHLQQAVVDILRTLLSPSGVDCCVKLDKKASAVYEVSVNLPTFSTAAWWILTTFFCFLYTRKPFFSDDNLPQT